MDDLLIRNGRVYDGTGAPWFQATVAVEEGRLRLLRGDTSGAPATQTIDATGLAVCPGFIDMHAHSGLVILTEPKHEPKVRQGVTTELIGVDGNSYAPFLSPEDFQAFAELNAGLDGRPPKGASWTSVEEYLSAFDNKVSVNVAYVIGNSPLRIAAVGWEERRPTSSEAQRMLDLLRNGMEEGAFGMSTGLNYPPGSYASTEELTELCKQVRRQGGFYVTHVRYPLGDRFMDPFREALDIGRQSGVAVHISHFASRMTAPGAARRLLSLTDAAGQDGVQVTFDIYPYPYTSTRLVAIIPEWAHNGGTRRMRERMQDSDERSRMGQDPGFQGRNLHAVLITGFTKQEYLPLDGMSMADIASALGKSTIDALCEVLLAEDMNLAYIGVVGSPVNIRDFIKHPGATIGSDGVLIGEHPNPRTYGCFPTVLGDLVREEGLLDLPEAIRKMTSFPAQCLGLSDRGILRDGFAADMVVFDPGTVRSPATLEQPKQFPQGIHYVIVNGQVVIDQGQHTGNMPGRALRRVD